ncbi:hypothetical protein ANO11243_080280 [Dothideomycetidae sp. 11243]|nr:hypothetical protein ANO11243_080280 [fungal sp. No.11243]
MMDIQFKEGTIPFDIPSVKKPCVTYYKIAGDLQCGKPPIICLHGGPGGMHRTVVDFAELWPRYVFPVILYDMIGCGQSTSLYEETAGDASFWTVSLFIDELSNLIDYFNLRDGVGFHILGASFGSMVGADFATTQPRGLRRLVLGCPYASTQAIVDGMRTRVNELPEKYRLAIDQAIKEQRFDTADFKTAYRAYYRSALCRADPLPAIFEKSIENVASPASTVLQAMRGPCVFGTRLGSLRGWDVTDRLHNIAAKTLLWHGEFDQTTDACVRPLFEHIPRVRWYTFAGASHIVTHEGEKLRKECMNLIGDFLTQDENDLSI